MAADERTMANWGVAAAAGAIGVAALVAFQGERPPSAPPMGAPIEVIAPNGASDPAAPADPASPASPPGTGPAPVTSTTNPPAKLPAISTPPKPVAAPPPSVQIAADGVGEAINPNLEFIVRFDGATALARAQSLYAAGDRAGAEAAAKQALAATPSLRGLCFSKFTLGAETVLAHCQRVSTAQMKTVSDRWTRRLRAMPDVDYADPNVILKNENPVRAPQ
jgi:hypothetical protein